MKRFALASVFIVLLSSKALADCSDKVCSNVSVTQIYVDATGDHYIETTGNEAGLSTCKADGGFLRIQGSDARSKELLSTILATVTSKKKFFAFRMKEGVSPCTVQYLQVNYPAVN